MVAKKQQTGTKFPEEKITIGQVSCRVILLTTPPFVSKKMW
jgi:hypothetical protein